MMNESAHVPGRLSRAVYERAESYLPWNVARLVFNTSIKPNWLEGSDRFWYKRSTRQGTEFVLIDSASGAREPLFDQQRLAAALSQASGTYVTHEQLPLDHLKLLDDAASPHIEFEFDGSVWICDLDHYICERGATTTTENLAEVRSPDGRWLASLRDGNVVVRDSETATERQLTDDAEPYFSYGALPEGRQSAITDKLLGRTLKPGLVWSPDSARLLTYRLDERNVREMHLLQSATPDDDVRPVLHSYRYPLPGDEFVEEAALLTIDVASGKATWAQMEPMVSVLHNPLDLNLAQWSKDGQSYYAIRGSRDRRQVELLNVDAETGEARTLREESRSTPVYPAHVPVETKVTCVREIGASQQITWFSSESGWGHLYLLDGQTGEQQCQLTSGAWNVRDKVHVDDTGRWIYFTACGREPNRDPYYRHLYRCAFDGGQLELLTPEDAEHDVTFAPSGAYFVDTFSRIDQPQSIVLRAADGRLVSELEQADISGLLERGWRFPERFCVKARDGVTDIYGMIIRPSSYDPAQKYPVLDAIYPGPQVIRTPKAFPVAANQFWQDQALAELGFVVITIDGFGTPYRSRTFIDVATGAGFGEAGGLLDHVIGIKQLGERDPSLDLERVGIYGHSGGGYASTRAMLLFPDFYKAAVSSAGNHDNLDYVALWAEAWVGLYERETYAHQDNVRLAANLKGKLLLVHGEMDDNVHPSETLRLVDALIAANKDFEMLIIPHTNHGIFDLRRGLAAFESDYARGHPYFTRKRWDFFVRHLIGLQPPEGFGIAGPGE